MQKYKSCYLVQFLNFMLVYLFSCKCGNISINSVVDRSKNNLQVLIDNVRQLEDLSPRILAKANKIRNSHILTNESPEFFCSQKLGDITSEKSLFCLCAGKGESTFLWRWVTTTLMNSQHKCIIIQSFIQQNLNFIRYQYNCNVIDKKLN